MIRIKGPILALMMIGMMTIPAWGVGTVNQSLAQIAGSTSYVYTENWTGDAANGSVPAAVMTGTTPIQGFRIISVEIAPGSPAPTNNYTVTVTDFSGADLLAGSGANQSNTTAGVLPSLSNSPPIYGSLTVNVTGNSVNSAQGKILIYFAPISQIVGNTSGGPTTTGTNLFTGANTFGGATTFNGAVTATNTATFQGNITSSATNSFSGTNTITGLFQCKNFENVQCVDSTFPHGGVDIGDEINKAYAALPVTGGTIWVFPNATGSCYAYTTPIVLNVTGKYVAVRGMGPTTCLNFTPTGGTSAAITAISEATNTVTATSTLNPAVGSLVAIFGYTSPADAYNGVFKVVTTSGTNFTVVNNLTGLAGAGAGTAQNTQSAITADYCPGAGCQTGGNYGFFDLTLQNGVAPCQTAGGCAGGVIGINIGPVNGGMGNGSIERVKIWGFAAGETINSPISFNIMHLNDTYVWNLMGVAFNALEEGDEWVGGLVEFNGTGISYTATNGGFKVAFTHFNSQTVVHISTGSSVGGGTLFGQATLTGLHMENLDSGGCGGKTTHYYFGQANLLISGGEAQDDCTSGNSDYWFKTFGQSGIYGLTIGSSGRTVTSLASVQSTADMRFLNQNPATLSPCFAFSVLMCSVTNLGGANPSASVPISIQPETTAPAALANDEVCYGDSTAHSLKCSYNNGAFFAIPQSVQNGLVFDGVYGTYRVTTDQTITAGASLTNIPGLTWTFPANTALNVKFTCDLLYSQATAAAIDSFGFQDVTVAPTNAEAYSRADTSATAFTAGNSAAAGVTTAVTVVTFTPSAATTVFGAHINGLIEQPSNASTSVFNIMAQFTTNNGTIKRGSSCQVF